MDVSLDDPSTAAQLSSAYLLDRLLSDEYSHRPWRTLRRGRPLDAKALADLLRPYGIGPVLFPRSTKKRVRGYQRVDFQDSWDRYLPRNPSESPVPPVPPVSSNGAESEG